MMLIGGFMKVVFTVDYNQEKFDQIRALGYELEYVNEDKIDESTFPYDADILVCFKALDHLDLDKFTKLKYIMLTSIGFDFTPNDKILEKNITLINNQGGYSIPMGEFIVFNILQLAKQNRSFMDNQKAKKWKLNTAMTEVYGKTALFLGTGTIAQEGAKRLQGFGMNVIGMNTDGRAVVYFDENVPLDQYREIFPKADYLISVLPSTENTVHFLDKEKLSLLPKGASVINVSRGSIINEMDLTELLAKGHLGGAALDVFEVEPLPQDSALWDMENVYVYPHSSWVSELMIERRLDLMYENLQRLKNGEKPKNIVNIQRGY